MTRLFAARLFYQFRPFRPFRPLCLIGTLVVVALFAGMAHAGVWGRCERVVDGDTVWVSGVGKVRLIGVDTPELGAGWTAADDEPGGRRAKEFVAKLIEGKRVRLEFDEERFDRYGRTLAYLYTEAGESLGELLLAQGLAEPIFYFPYRMKARYFSLWRAQRAE